jgi:hypothetical protein
MVPRAVQDAGYTAVGLGVLALQEVQKRRRVVRRQAQAVVNGMKAAAAPVTRRLETLPRLPGPIGQVMETGRGRLCEALRP